MKKNIKKLFQKSLNLDSIYEESKKNPSKNVPEISHLAEFKKQSSNIIIFPLDAKENHSEN